MLRYLSALLLTCVVALPAQATKIVVSIKPLQLITYDIAYGVSEPELLISANASPHTYALKPSDIKKIAAADLLVWFGPDLESFLTNAVKKSSNALELSASETLLLRAFEEQESHEEHGHESHGHEGHNHGMYDPHIWLGPEQARQVAQIIAERLSEVDPENAAIYAENYQNFSLNLEKTVNEIREQLAPVKGDGYYVFHDAYGYFEQYFGLNNLGHFTVSPDRKPGAKTLIHIRSELKKGKAKCVFAEPQFEPAVIQTVIRGSDVNSGTLDPLATDIVTKQGSYFTFLHSLADEYTRCLSAK
ncbi:zinc ABC transporter substrate-binding protein ZnuA [Vibrio albus]|uniref:High-affinity zinc uptake system protein ZnuA n=1 Tax=Vibrio albus TaxID=2200953 RepID=A0A2U3BDZ6_9VIBR|nr:zinc ABC transporter substrate-binding protein ZnuA [Vibrio albus]PWI35028.1 zinc ABC transporter substrate-binding protein ZnuA [Vibrio albus]